MGELLDFGVTGDGVRDELERPVHKDLTGSYRDSHCSVSLYFKM